MEEAVAAQEMRQSDYAIVTKQRTLQDVRARGGISDRHPRGAQPTTLETSAARPAPRHAGPDRQDLPHHWPGMLPIRPRQAQRRLQRNSEREALRAPVTGAYQGMTRPSL